MVLGGEWITPIALGIPIWVMFRSTILAIRKLKCKTIDINKEIIVNLFALYILFLIVLMLLPTTLISSVNITQIGL